MSHEVPQSMALPPEHAFEIPNKGVAALVHELMEIGCTDAHSFSARSALLAELANQKFFPSLEPLLPLVLNLNGKPYSLVDHYPFAPMFRLLMPKNMVLKTGRQVSKSTSLSAHGVVLSNCIPFFKTLYVTPLFEQIRRFSNNYVRPFIDQSPVKSQWSGTDTENNVLQRSFKNKSIMLFSFALLDADRVRGVSADRVCFDESVRAGTMVATPAGARAIEAFSRGDVVLSFDTAGAIHEDRVVTCSSHGTRECYRFEFANGASLEVTSDSFIATSSGWKRASKIIEEFHAAAVAVDSGHAAGRRLHNTRALPKSARLLPACLQQGEVPDIVRVRKRSSQETEESRLRRMVECLGQQHLAAVAPYSGYVLPGGQEDGDGCLATPVDVGSGCVVVSGRREFVDARAEERFSYRRAGRAQCVSAGGVVTEERHCGQGADASQKRSRGAVSCHSPVGTGHAATCGEYPAVRCAGDAVQDQIASVEENIEMPLVQENIYAEDNSACSKAQAVLRQRGVRAEAARRQQREVYKQPGSAGEQELATSGCILRELGRKSRTQSNKCRGVARAQSRQGKEVESETTSKIADCQIDETLDMQKMRFDGTARSTRFAGQVLPAVPRTDNARDQAPVCFESSAIVKITCTGAHPVYDIETEKHHTFFAGGVAVHNCQDMDPDHIPIIQETMSYSRFAMTHFTGTPKSMDNPLEGLYKRSSGAEWFIPCESCRHWNIPSIDHDLDAMIGGYNIHISEKHPGTVCAKCRKPINPRHGRWVHRYPDRRWQFSGYHVPQLILPLHFSDPEKWSTLLLKREGFGNMTQAQFYNEVLGESIDSGQKLVTETELKAACQLEWENKREPDQKCLDTLNNYKHRVLAIDWGGGGEEGISFTVLALLGFSNDGTIDVLWGKRIVLGADHLAEAVECMRWAERFRVDYVAHDYTGAGTVRETVMVQAGFNLDKVMAVRLVRAASQDIMVFKPATAINHRQHYSLDKTRSLLYACQAIKLKQIKFFQYDWSSQDNPGLIADFLALVENKAESRLAGDIYTITRNTLLSDDFAQAVNLGCAAIWHINAAWPNFAEIAGLGRISARAAVTENPDNWADDDERGGFFGTP